ncbi:hypothetical protein GCM10022415_18260 [Knoellia locipacati]|uniref:Uncharacterized protein n=2 Tax=Knoellia locipacati TaxID=882824 RepID=A0A512T0T4_9MICO|nr:hypothetical protein KLO01_18210 [Knoellia locipacati]
MSLFGCAFIAGCTSGQRVEADGLIVLIAEPANSGDAALLSGKLTDVGGCVGIENYAVVWPHGTRVSGEGALSLTVPGQPKVALGDQVHVGGGVLFEAEERRAVYSIAGVSIPASCVSAGVWMSSPSD